MGKTGHQYVIARENNFQKAENPVIGKRYHIAWAYSGAVFKLVRIEGDKCFLDNPKHKRENLLECNISDLLEVR